MIASSAFFVLDAILDWPVSLYDGSWSQWGQMSGSSVNGGMLIPSSPLRTDIPSRSELVVYNYSTDPNPVFFTGIGLNDMTLSSGFTGTANRNFRIQIDGLDTVSIFNSASTGTIATSFPISAGTTTVLEGITVTFGAATGHTLGDRWDFITKRAVELLAFDGSICSSSTSAAGVTTVSPAGCTPVAPNSYAITGNEIETADAAYFGSGGGGGVRPIAPGY